jgi:hypothetical protein
LILSKTAQAYHTCATNWSDGQTCVPSENSLSDGQIYVDKYIA